MGPAYLARKENAMTNLHGQPSIIVPPLPEVEDVTVDPKTTALLVLDMLKQRCNLERTPSCVASIPKVETLLKHARANRMLVVHSLHRNAQVTDIIAELVPLGGEPIVSSGPDKFIGTELESILKENNIEQVIVTGTAAHGAALHTAAGAAFRGFKAIVPVDGISAEPFPEYYTVWHLVNAPRLSDQVTISRSDKIRLAG
jgi:nicotinamidase-related amidase